MTMTRRWLIVASACIAATLAGCTGLNTLNTLNTLTPGDGGVVQVARDMPFGSDARQQLDIYAPRTAARAPVVVFFYGGSWRDGSRRDYAFAARAIASRGFVVVVPDYRLVPQVGYPAFVEDGAAAVAWTTVNIGRHGGDPARIGVAGHSAGAYIALMLAVDPRWLARAGAAGAIKAAVGIAGPYDFYPFEPGGAAQAAFGAFPDPRDTQPVTHASAAAPPVLLLTGDADTTVKPRNAAALAAALAANGASATVRTYPGVGHIGIVVALSKPFRGKAPVLADTTTFLHEKLGR